MTASLSDLALCFARDVLGWEKADSFTIGQGHRVVRNLTPGDDAGDIFNVSDHSGVLFRVARWCDAHSACLTIDYAPGTWSVLISLCDEEGAYDRGEASDADLCRALMEASVQAAGKFGATIAQQTKGSE